MSLINGPPNGNLVCLAPKTQFLGLPREIRDMIYHFALEVDYEIIPYPTIHESKFRGTRPAIALLRVNKQVRTEARPILYSNNEWQIGDRPEFSIDAGAYPNLFQVVDNSLFKHVVIKFSGDDVPMLSTQTLSLAAHYHARLEQELLNSGVIMTEEEKRQWRAGEMHNLNYQTLLRTWNTRVSLLRMMKDLKTVRVDFNTCYCPSGCCRLRMFQAHPVERCLQRLPKPGKHSRNQQTEVYFHGIESKEECQIIYDNYGFRRSKHSWR